MIIQHRINSIELLQNVPKNYGVEVDLRSSEGDIICSHDPFVETESFYEWIKSYDHRYLIANIKSEGIEKQVLNILLKNKIENFFFLDVSFPFMFKLREEGFRNFAYRVSDLEKCNLDTLNMLDCSWIWLDAFKNFPSNEVANINKAKLKGTKICLVSPELHIKRRQDISSKILNEINASNVEYDAVCTKDPSKWQ